MVRAMLVAATLAATPVPHQPVTIPDIVEVTDIGSLAISPDGQLVAFRTERARIATNDFELRWYVAPVDGHGPVVAIGDGGAAQIEDFGAVEQQVPVWAPSSKALYFRALINGEVQVWRAPVDGRGPQRITQDPANVRNLRLGADGRSIDFDSGATRDEVARAERAADDGGILIDKSVDAAMPLTRGGFVDGRFATTRLSGDWFDRAGMLWDAPTHSATVSMRGEDAANASSPAAPPYWTVTIDRPTSRAILKVSHPDLPDMICKSPLCIEGHINAAVPIGDGRSLLVTTTDPYKRQTLSLWTPATNEWRLLVHAAGFLNGRWIIPDTPCAVRGSTIACVAAEPSGPPRLVTVDLKTGVIRTLFDPNQALRAHTLPVRLIHWKTDDGMDFAGQLVLPQTPPPPSGYPLVMNYYYCGGFMRGGLGDEQPMMPLAEHGIASLCIESAPVYTTGLTRPWELDVAVKATTAAVRTLAADKLIDPTRVGMDGLSFGSEAEMAVVQRTHLLRAASIASTQIEPHYFWLNALPGRDFPAKFKTYFGMGDPDTDPQAWARFSPARDIASIRTPLLMQMPENEMRLSMELFAKLANSGTPTEMYGFTHETHLKHQPRHKAEVYERNLDWFRFWLQGYVDPDPAKAAQYTRWKAFSARPGYALPAQD